MGLTVVKLILLEGDVTKSPVLVIVFWERVSLIPVELTLRLCDRLWCMGIHQLLIQGQGSHMDDCKARKIWGTW